jgi:hypothetical protein
MIDDQLILRGTNGCLPEGYTRSYLPLVRWALANRELDSTQYLDPNQQILPPPKLLPSLRDENFLKLQPLHYDWLIHAVGAPVIVYLHGLDFVALVSNA